LEKVAKGYENEPEKGARCERCFRYNLEKTAKFAKEHGLDAFTTSLTVSPHKVSPVIFKCGEEVALDNTPFLKVDFKKNNGFLCSTKRAKELNLYRQSYCGCEFSKKHLDKKP
jgi:predicted adenine nucleotide alpha hydrolase (AANH) superfamily ATPase